MRITNHAKVRAEQRLNLPLEPFLKLSAKALVTGLSHNQTTGRLNKYVTRLYMQGKSANNIKIYGEFIYLFQNDKLITVFAVPNDLKAISNKLQKKLK